MGHDDRIERHVFTSKMKKEKKTVTMLVRSRRSSRDHKSETRDVQVGAYRLVKASRLPVAMGGWHVVTD